MVLFITLFVFSLAESYSVSINFGGGGGSTCTANSTLGASCSCNQASCPPGTACQCSGGLFTADCGCVSTGGGAGFTKPSLGSQVLQDADALKNYCISYGTSNMTSLSNLIGDVINTYNNGSNSDYSYAENTYKDFFLGTLTSSEKNDINAWVQSHGYPGF